MNIDVGSLRAMVPSLGIPPHRHYDPGDVEDAALRLEWAKFLFRAGYRLRYPQETTGTAVLLFHRFLIQERVGKHRRSREVILTTCLFLAGKVTEAPRRLRDVINVLHMLTRTSQDEPPLLDKAYWTMKERIVEFEQVLLRSINFQVDPPDPYRLLLNYARSLRLGRPATRTAWGIVNDVLFCPRALSAPPPAVACAAIRIATQIHGSSRRLRWFSPPSESTTEKKSRKRPRAGGLSGDVGGVSGVTQTDAEAALENRKAMDVDAGNIRKSAEDSQAGDGVSESRGEPGKTTATAAAPGDDREPAARTLAGADGVRQHDPGKGQSEEPRSKEDGEGARDSGISSHTGGAGDNLRLADDVRRSVRSDPGASAGDAIGLSGGLAESDGGSAVGEAPADAGEDAQPRTTPWWRLFDARDEEVELVCSELMSLYRLHHDEMSSGAKAGDGVNVGSGSNGASAVGSSQSIEASSSERRLSSKAVADGATGARAAKSHGVTIG